MGGEGKSIFVLRELKIQDAKLSQLKMDQEENFITAVFHYENINKTLIVFSFN